MFAIPSFDPKTFTDDQIVKKMTELSRKIVYANRFSGSYELVVQLQNFMGVLEFERRERLYRQMYEMHNNLFPEIIETEPDLKVESNGEKQKKEQQQTRNIEDTPRKSKRPQHQPEVAQRSPLGPTGQSIT
jgi:hypothetical protein